MKLTETQQAIVDRFTQVGSVDDKYRNKIVIKGYAGTGKTTVASKLIDNIPEWKKIIIVAPTTTALANIKDRIKKAKNIYFKTFASIAKEYVNCVNILDQKYSMSEEFENTNITLNDIVTIEKNEDKILGFYNFLDFLKINNIQIDEIASSYYKYNKKSNKKIKSYKIIESKLQEKLMKIDPKKFNKKNISVSDEFIFNTNKLISSLFSEKFNDAIIIFEEISMIDQNDMNNLLKTIKEYGTKDQKFVFLGDGSQLPPVEGAKNSFITSPKDDKDIFELTEILRSDKETINTLANKIRRGVDISMLYGDIIEYVDADNVQDIYESYKEKILEADCIITYTNKSVNMLNNRIRQDKFNTTEFVVKNEEIMVTENIGADFHNGEMFTIEKIYETDELEKILTDLKLQKKIDHFLKMQHFNSVGKINNSAYTIEDYISDYEKLISGIKIGLCKMCVVRSKMNKKRNILIPFTIDKDRRVTQSKASDDSLLVELSNAATNLSGLLRNVYSNEYEDIGNELKIEMGNFTRIIKCNYAYAMTVHKAQGSEWNKVVVILSTKDLFMLRKGGIIKELVYTAITRAKEQLLVMVY